MRPGSLLGHYHETVSNGQPTKPKPSPCLTRFIGRIIVTTTVADKHERHEADPNREGHQHAEDQRDPAVKVKPDTADRSPIYDAGRDDRRHRQHRETGNNPA